MKCVRMIMLSKKYSSYSSTASLSSGVYDLAHYLFMLLPIFWYFCFTWEMRCTKTKWLKTSEQVYYFNFSYVICSHALWYARRSTGLQTTKIRTFLSKKEVLFTIYVLIKVLIKYNVRTTWSYNQENIKADKKFNRTVLFINDLITRTYIS